MFGITPRTLVVQSLSPVLTETPVVSPTLPLEGSRGPLVGGGFDHRGVRVTDTSVWSETGKPGVG